MRFIGGHNPAHTGIETQGNINIQINGSKYSDTLDTKAHMASNFTGSQPPLGKPGNSFSGHG
jgi:hypothetical protein